MAGLGSLRESLRLARGRLAGVVRGRVEVVRRVLTRRGELEVFPWLEHATAVGGLAGHGVGLAYGLSLGLGPGGLILRALLGTVAGGLAGITVALCWAASPRADAPAPDWDVVDLWDPWLDYAVGGGDPVPDDEPVVEIVEERPPVRPRVRSSETGESVPLLEEIGPILARYGRGAIRLMGRYGSGKSTALAYLAQMVPAHFGVVYLDGPDRQALAEAAERGRVIIAGSGYDAPEILASLELAPWGRDEWIEYLLAGDRRACASVMTRLAECEAETGLLEGIPELWQVVLDRMSRHEWIKGPREALRAELHVRLADPELWSVIADVCQAALLTPGSLGRGILESMRRHIPQYDLFRLLRHRAAQLVMISDKLADDLAQGLPTAALLRELPLDLVCETASRIAPRPAAVETLMRLVADPRETFRHPMAASLLHALGRGWRPGAPAPCLKGAYLKQADWADIDLTFAELNKADLRGATLWRARLDRGRMERAKLAGANLRDAQINFAHLEWADLTGARLCNVLAGGAFFGSACLQGADLSHANLDQASFWRADLRGARLAGASLVGVNFLEAKLAGADLRRADLSRAEMKGLSLAGVRLGGARFHRADLTRCNLERVALPGANFSRAVLMGALLTGSNLRDADLQGACLLRAGLAEVDWQDADLRGADLRDAAFHLGSSRSGMVGSTIPCEGSRTGFYTDEFHEQDYKSPEEIRKANLQGADLRGAHIEGVDFYLVDLRGARLDPEQLPHLRRCGAILESRA